MTKNISGSPNVFIKNKQIKQVNECKTLGVTIDQHLSWKSNTDKICKKQQESLFTQTSYK